MEVQDNSLTIKFDRKGDVYKTGGILETGAKRLEPVIDFFMLEPDTLTPSIGRIERQLAVDRASVCSG